MIKYSFSLEKLAPFSRSQIEHLVQLAGRFSSHVWFEYKSRIINGKSMLGLLSLTAMGSGPILMVVEGEDEVSAAAQLKRLLEAGVTAPKDITDAHKLLQTLKGRLIDVLGSNLVGIYVHGSMAQNSFHWGSSDIDFLVVVKSPLKQDKKIALIRTLEGLNTDAPPKGIEMSVILADDARKVPHPMPFDLHYSPRWHNAAQRDIVAFCQQMNGVDADLTAHIMMLNSAAIVVHGPSVPRVFGTISREDYLDSIKRDLVDARTMLHENPVYYVLNLCRALAYFRDGKLLSKQQGGEWGLENLNKRYQGVVQAALNAYRNGRDMFYDEGHADELCDDVLEELGI